MNRLDPIRAVEACYARHEDDGAWSRGILDALTPVSNGSGLCFVVDLRDSTMSWTPLAQHGFAPDWQAMVEMWRSSPPEIYRAMFRPSPPVDIFSRRVSRLLEHCGPTFAARCSAFASRLTRPIERPAAVKATARATELTQLLTAAGDKCALLGALHDGRQCVVTLTVEKPPSPRTIHQLTRIAAHLTSAWRLRRRLAEATGPEEPDAVLDPSGKLLDARPRAQPGPARVRLVEAVRRLERARGRLRRTGPDEALGLWRGLVNGTWSLVDQVDSDRRRFVLARRNDPGVRDPKALIAGERDVAAHVAMGHSNKYIAYLLGISASTVAGRVDSVRAKLGLRSRRELIEFLGGGTSRAPGGSLDPGNRG
jgi:DNA-binding CsgD family transcriptional regulator